MAIKLGKGVLKGTQYKEVFQVEWQGQTYEVEIRALSDAEATQVEELMQEGITVKATPGRNGKMDRQMVFDPKANLRGRKMSDVKAAALGTTDPELTEEVIREEWPTKIIREVGERVKQISGIGNQEEVETFRDTGGDDSNGES